MRKLCPNLEREDALDTVLEVPIPEEMFAGSSRSRSRSRSRWEGAKHHLHLGGGCTNVKAWMARPQHTYSAFAEPHHSSSLVGRGGELQLMLGVIGAPLVPLPVAARPLVTPHFQQDPIESSMAKYIVQQYVAASGGEGALGAVSSMYAMGKVRLAASELNGSGSDVRKGSKLGAACSGGGDRDRDREMGGFVLWQKNPDLWCLELVVSGCKISAGSDGRVAWRQTPWHQSHASRGPPRPLRRSLQGLDPMLTANLFSNSSCIGEKAVDGEDCFVLKLDAEAATLRARNSSSVEIIRHTVWGYFSQRTGLLVQLEDSHLLQIKSSHGNVYWETTMESHIEDYRPVDGINIAHAGRSNVSLFRFGDNNDGNTRTRMEETWTIEEVDFNIWGLSIDCFLPPSDLREGGSQEPGQSNDVKVKNPGTAPPATGRIGPSKVAAIDLDEQDSTSEEDGKS